MAFVAVAALLAGCTAMHGMQAHAQTTNGQSQAEYGAYPARSSGGSTHKRNSKQFANAALQLSGACGLSDNSADTVGAASFYGHQFAGQLTANGERFNPHKLTAAHRTLAFGTRVLVTDLKNGKHVIVRINDRGPFVHTRIIDLSRRAAQQLGMLGTGTVKVRLQVLSPNCE